MPRLEERVLEWLQRGLKPSNSKQMVEGPTINEDCMSFIYPGKCWMKEDDGTWTYLCNFVVCGGNDDGGGGGFGDPSDPPDGTWPPDDPLPPGDSNPPGDSETPEGGGAPSDDQEQPELVKPCPGDPVANPTIASSGLSGITGGTFGCVRTGNKRCNGIPGSKFHGGLDYEMPVGSEVFPMHTGKVIAVHDLHASGSNSRHPFGNYIIINCIVNGKALNITYAHLNEIYVTEGQTVNDLFLPLGTSGISGNASESIPHLHIRVNDALGFNEIEDPQVITHTKFDQNGNPIIKPCN